jgi:hypothetical protein
MAGAWLGRFRRFAVFDPALVSQIAAFLRFALAFWRLAVFVHFFLDEACAFLDFTLDAHVGLLLRFDAVKRVMREMRGQCFCSLQPAIIWFAELARLPSVGSAHWNLTFFKTDTSSGGRHRRCVVIDPGVVLTIRRQSLLIWKASQFLFRNDEGSI